MEGTEVAPRGRPGPVSQADAFFSGRNGGPEDAETFRLKEGPEGAEVSFPQ